MMAKVVRLDHDETIVRIRFIKYIIGAFLILSLALLIVIAFTIPTIAAYAQEQGMKQIRAQNDAHQAEELDNLKKARQTVESVLMGVVVFMALFHLFLIWGVLKEIVCVIMTFAVLETIGILASVSMWNPMSACTGIGSFLLNVILTILAYYLAYLIMNKRRTAINHLSSPYPSV